MPSRKLLVGSLAALVAVGALGGGAYSGYRVWRHFQPVPSNPPPRASVVLTGPSAPPATSEPTPTAAPTPTPLPPSVLIKVPYTSQFPFRQFSDTAHQQYCEAAALAMVAAYFKGDTRDRFPPAEADSTMGQIFAAERRTFPGVVDLPLASIGTIGVQQYGLRPSVTAIDLAQIERNLAEGRPVIIPVMTHGFGGPGIAPGYREGNVYHVILVTGYDSARGVLYTNDAGFTAGQNYAYGWSTLAKANEAQTSHVPQGRVMLVFDRA